jgi:hypothetical protein
MMDLSFVTGQVVLAPSTITQGVTLLVGTPLSEVTISVVRTGLVTVDVPGVDSAAQLASDIIPTMPSSSIPTVFVTASASGVAGQSIAPNQPFSLPTQQAVVIQAPCVSACLQERLIASAAGPCALTAGTNIDNACACLSAPLVAIHALTNCASAACNGVAAGPAGLAADLVAVTNLYQDYCTSAVGASALNNAIVGGQAAAFTTTAAESSITRVTDGTVTANATASTDTASPWMTSASNNGTLAGNTTIAGNGTLGGAATLTAGPSAVESGMTAGLASSISSGSVGASSTTASPGVKSQACLKLRHKPGRSVILLLVPLAVSHEFCSMLANDCFAELLSRLYWF